LSDSLSQYWTRTLALNRNRRDWVELLRPDLKPQVKSLFGNNRALQNCHDLCNAHKHFELDPKRRKDPLSVKEVDRSAAPVTLADIHDRMPVLVFEGNYDEWLNEGSPGLLRPIPSDTVKIAKT
jgi:hypothetical protein